MNTAGRIGFDMKGEYSPTATYDFLDVVFYQKSSYVAKKLTTGNAPVKSNEYWQILTEAEGITADGDISDTTVTFTEAKDRENIASGEKTGTLFGKIRKVISDLKTVAFSGKYSDLTGTPGEMTGATASAVGTSGLVPGPGAGKQAAFLRGDKTWANLGAAAMMGVANNDTTTEEGFLWDARRGKALRDDVNALNSACQSAKYFVTFSPYLGTTLTGITTYCDSYGENFASQTYYRFVVNQRVDGFIGMGVWYIEGYKASNDYEWQFARSYNSISSNGIKYRVKQAGAWKEWETVS